MYTNNDIKVLLGVKFKYYKGHNIILYLILIVTSSYLYK